MNERTFVIKSGEKDLKYYALLAWRQDFDTGIQGPISKLGSYRVRPVRTF